MSTEDNSVQINSTSIKLPDFWTKSPTVWFARIESQFNTKGITQDQTKYDYVVSSLDVDTAHEIQHVLIHPPATEKYASLKKVLIKTFDKSQFEKDAELLTMNGLGDRRPTALMRKIQALNDDPTSLKRAIFLTNLPSDIRSILLAQNLTDLDQLAEAADRVWESRASVVRELSSSAHSEAIESATTIDAISSTSKKSLGNRARKPASKPVQDNAICFYHMRFGMEARKCHSNCKFASLLSTKVSGNA